MDLDTFRKLAVDRRVVPVSRRLLADGDTPVGLYRKLAAERPGTFLLESAENGRTWSRYSFIGVRSAATLTARDGEAHWLGAAPVGVPLGGDPLEALRATVETLHTPRDLVSDLGLPPFTGGMVGYLGYDVVRRLEKIGEHGGDDLQLPELTMLLTSDLAVLDHRDGAVLLIANAINHNDLDTGVDEAYADAVARLDAMERDLRRPVENAPAVLPPPNCPPAPHGGAATPTRTPSSTSRSASGPARRSRSSPPSGSRPPAPRAPSTSTGCCGPPTRPRTCTSSASTDSTSSAPVPRPWSRSRTAGPWSTPSPEPGTGAPPPGGPGARRGTARRPQGARRAPDARRPRPQRPGAGLRTGQRGGRRLHVDRALLPRDAHRLHRHRPGHRGPHRLRRAHRLLPRGHPLRGPQAARHADHRGAGAEPPRLYGGCVGYLDFAGDSDTAIAIRTALLRDGTAYVQAGAGVVADSDPVAEDTECRNKAAAVLRAVHTANRLHDR